LIHLTFSARKHIRNFREQFGILNFNLIALKVASVCQAEEKKYFCTEKSNFYSKSRKFYSIGNTAQKYFKVNLLFLCLPKIHWLIALTFLLCSKNMIFLNLLKNPFL
jgi:hypothetical protein